MSDPLLPPIYPPDICERYATQVQINLEKGFIDQAHRVIDQFEQIIVKDRDFEPERTDPMETNWSETELAPILVGILDSNGHITIGDSLRKSRNKVLTIRNLGPLSVRTMQQIAQGLGAIGCEGVHPSWLLRVPTQRAIDNLRAASE